MAYLIDNGILSALATCWLKGPSYLPHQPTAWRGIVNVAVEVRSECGLQGIDQIFWNDNGNLPLIQVHRISTLQAATALSRVRPNSANATKNLGEDVSLALLMSDLSTSRWVSLDQLAERRALHELGGDRVCSPYEFLIDLTERGLLEFSGLEHCKKAYERRLQALVGLPARLQARYDALKRAGSPR